MSVKIYTIGREEKNQKQKEKTYLQALPGQGSSCHIQEFFLYPEPANT